MKKTFFAIGLVMLLALGCNSQSETQSTNQEQSNVPETAKGVKTYTSQKLGVSFKYSDPDVKVTEIGNKIYVHGNAMKPEEGQSVEIWSKPAEQSIEAAVKSKILVNAPAKCVVETNKSFSGAQSNFIGAVITTADIQKNLGNLGSDEFFENIKGCPVDYSVTNGARYFAMDTKHPSKFMFFSIGQYAINGETSTSGWQDSLIVK